MKTTTVSDFVTSPSPSKVVDQNERVCYLGRGTTSAPPILHLGCWRRLGRRDCALLGLRGVRGLSSNVCRWTWEGRPFLQGYLTQVVRAALLFEAVVVSKNLLGYLIIHCSVPNHIYTLHFTMEGREEKVGCFAASALHRVPILHFRVASGLLQYLYCSIHPVLYSFRLISCWRISANGIYP